MKNRRKVLLAFFFTVWNRLRHHLFQEERRNQKRFILLLPTAFYLDAFWTGT
jgi:hypothetical protein